MSSIALKMYVMGQAFTIGHYTTPELCQLDRIEYVSQGYTTANGAVTFPGPDGVKCEAEQDAYSELNTVPTTDSGADAILDKPTIGANTKFNYSYHYSESRTTSNAAPKAVAVPHIPSMPKAGK